MADRIPFDTNALRLAPTPVRSDLAVKAPPTSSELPNIAVAGTNASHQTSADGHTAPNSHLLLGEIWRGLDQIQRSERRQKELDQLRARLIGHKDLAEQNNVDGSEMDLEADLQAISALAQDRLATDEAMPLMIIGQKPEASNAAERVSEADRDRVLARIEQALKDVGMLRTALASDTESAYDRLINLKSSINDLNMARTRVDDAQFGLHSASDTVEAVMLHMRAAIVAHGKMSPELVRLVLN